MAHPKINPIGKVEKKKVHRICADLANFKIVVNVVFEDILTLKRVRHILSSKWVIVLTKLVINN